MGMGLGKRETKRSRKEAARRKLDWNWANGEVRKCSRKKPRMSANSAGATRFARHEYTVYTNMYCINTVYENECVLSYNYVYVLRMYEVCAFE